MRRMLLALISSSSLFAQVSTPVMRYDGAPLAIAYSCSDEDLDSAGLDCSDETCAMYADLTAVEGNGSLIVVAGNIHSSSATVSSLVLRSEDAGRTWTEPVAQIRGASLERIQLIDSSQGWISGEMLQPLPMNPFFLVTSDAGKTWDRIPLLEDGTPGMVLTFAFDSRDHGTAIVDDQGDASRYELWESDSGGRGWTLKTSSDKKPQMPPPAESSWRIVPEQKLLRLQHLEDGHWTPFASFRTHIADCRRQPPFERADIAPQETERGDTKSSQIAPVQELRLGGTQKSGKPKQ